MKSSKIKLIRTVHPFPARMAPELVFEKLRSFEPGAIVLDPMVGSGTVLRHASELGHRPVGFDLDPLAVLMSKVWTSKVNDHAIAALFRKTQKAIRRTPARSISLPWIDDDPETKTFINYWFAAPQRKDLRRVAFALAQHKRLRKSEAVSAANILKIAFSRLIITKDTGASLARDVSHSRPHKVAKESEYDVLAAFEHSVKTLRSLLAKTSSKYESKIGLGDVRSLKLRKRSVDVVLTSPPYLNAIDYMRGHRLSLVWLGYRLGDLRKIRSNSIGAERGVALENIQSEILAIQTSMGKIDKLSRRHQRMITRYAKDIRCMMSEISRVLKPKGRAILVVGNSCLENVFVNNAKGIRTAASQAGLRLFGSSERSLPDSKRYLPTPAKRQTALGKRIRTEAVLTFGIR